MNTLLTCCMGVIIASSVVPPLQAQELPASISSSQQWADTRASRRDQASEWLAEASRLEKQIPTLSPAEQAWLKVEYDDEIARDGHFTPRAVRARHSKEGAARFAKPIARSMVVILEHLASSAPLSQGKEVALWTELSILALDLNFWGDVSTLGEMGVLTRDPKLKLTTTEYQQFLRGTWASRVEEVLRAVVLPHLRRLDR